MYRKFGKMPLTKRLLNLTCDRFRCAYTLLSTTLPWFP